MRIVVKPILIGLMLLFVGSFGFINNWEDDQYKSMFNGIDLTGWDGQPGAWEVMDGAIQCTGRANGRNWLIWREFGVSDFELRLEFKYKRGNSGVQVRSADIGDWQVRGYQVEVSEREGMGLWHHSLMSKEIEAQDARRFLATAGQRVHISGNGVKRVEQYADPELIKKSYKEGEWNEMVIIARGNRLIQEINGVIFSDLTDDELGFSADRGVVALQDHGKGTEAAFRNIRIKVYE